MTVVPEVSSLTSDRGALVLARYAQLIGYGECAFFGVRNDAELELYECRTIWLKAERDMVLKYLLEAQEEIEQRVHYPLRARWFADEQRPFSYPVDTLWRHIIEAGVMVEDDVELGSVVSHAADPAVVGPIAVGFTDESEVRIYHPGTDMEIHPSVITISGGNLTISIPRCRMVTEAASDNPRVGIDYSTIGNFEATVDVKRQYNDPSTHATMVWPHRCGSVCATAGCSEYTQDGCMYITNHELGWVDVLPANYTAGSWRRTTACCTGAAELVRLNYRAGLTELSMQAEDAILRLAHAKMPEEPCGCSISQRLWERDRNVPEALTQERVNCPFGMSDGAWVAWKFAGAMKVWKAPEL